MVPLNTFNIPFFSSSGRDIRFALQARYKLNFLKYSLSSIMEMNHSPPKCENLNQMIFVKEMDTIR